MESLEPSLRSLYLDVTPLLTPEEAGGSDRAAIRRRGLGGACTLDSDEIVRHFTAETCKELIKHLQSAGYVVGYNCINSDYEVIHGQRRFRRPKTIDLLQECEKYTDRKLSLDFVLRATIGEGRLAGRRSMAKACKEGNHKRVVRALTRNLKMMRKLHQHVNSHGWDDVALAICEADAAHETLDNSDLNCPFPSMNEDVFRWVINGVLARGARPGYPLEKIPRKVVDAWATEIQREKIRSVLCLLSEYELTSIYPGYDLLEVYRSHGLQTVHFPIDDLSNEPTKLINKKILDLATSLPQPLFVHCNMGVERTGAMVEKLRKRLEQSPVNGLKTSNLSVISN